MTDMIDYSNKANKYGDYRNLVQNQDNHATTGQERVASFISELEIISSEPVAERLMNSGKLGFSKSNWTHSC